MTTVTITGKTVVEKKSGFKIRSFYNYCIVDNSKGNLIFLSIKRLKKNKTFKKNRFPFKLLTLR